MTKQDSPAQAIATTTALLIALEMIDRNRPAPGVAIQIAIREYVHGFWPLLDIQPPPTIQLQLPNTQEIAT